LRQDSSHPERPAVSLPPSLAARRRALAAVLAWICGTLLASALAVPAWWWWAGASMAVLAAALLRGRGSLLACALAAAFLAAGWFNHRIDSPDPLALNTILKQASRAPDHPTLITVHATITEPPRFADPAPGVLSRFAPSQSPRLRMIARVSSLETSEGPVRAHGEISVWIETDKPPDMDLGHGQPVKLTGIYTPVTPALNPGQPDRVRLARQAGRVGSLSLTSTSLILPARHDSWSDHAAAASRRFLAMFRERASRALDAATPEGESRALVKALILGESDPGLDEATAIFSRLGIVHILSISGFHVSAMALFVSFLVRLLGERGRWQTALLALPIFAYLLLVPAQAPVLRAGVLALVIILAELASRRYDQATLLLWTCIGLLIWRPMDLWSLGFQLSCGMTLALLWIGPLAHDKLWGARVIIPGAWRRVTPLRLFTGALTSAASVSLLCWSLSTPLVAWRTGQVSLLAVIASVLLAPVFAALMYLSFAALLIGILIPPVASVVSWTVGVAVGELARLALALASALDAVPASSFLSPPIPWWAALALTASVLWWWVRGDRRSPVSWAVAAASVAILAAGITLTTRLPRDVILRLDTLAVADGSCHIVRSGDQALLWDCGSLRPGVGVRELPAAMRALGIWRIPTAVISHGDYDHYAALPDLADRIGLKRVLAGDRFLARAAASPEGPAAALLQALRERSIDVIPVSAAHHEPFGAARITFLSPPPSAPWPTENDHSLVARFDDLLSGSPDAPALLLLTGDIQSAAIASLRDRFPDLQARAVEAPHHGSNRSDAAAWVASLSPQAVVQSTGVTRAFARSASVWDDVKANSRWLTTARDGAIRIDIPRAGPLRTSAFRLEPTP
jgi:competence protein ComEC